MQTDAFPGGAEFTRTAEFIKQQLGRVGIDVEIRKSDLPCYMRRIYGDYEFDTSSMYNGAFPDPSAGIQRMYWTKAAQKGVPYVDLGGGLIGSNFATVWLTPAAG